jgi:hypothetical protein
MRKCGSIVCNLRPCHLKGPTNSASMRTIVTAALQRQYLQTELILWILLVLSRRTHKNTPSSIALFTAPSHSNGSYPVVACVFLVTGICLPSRYSATDLHITMWHFNGRLFWHHFSSFWMLEDDARTRREQGDLISLLLFKLFIFRIRKIG